MNERTFMSPLYLSVAYIPEGMPSGELPPPGPPRTFELSQKLPSAERPLAELLRADDRGDKRRNGCILRVKVALALCTRGKHSGLCKDPAPCGHEQARKALKPMCILRIRIQLVHRLTFAKPHETTSLTWAVPLGVCFLVIMSYHPGKVDLDKSVSGSVQRRGRSQHYVTASSSMGPNIPASWRSDRVFPWSWRRLRPWFPATIFAPLASFEVCCVAVPSQWERKRSCHCM